MGISKTEALAEHFGVDESEVEENSWGYEVEGEEWIVATPDEAYELAKESLINLFDDIGVFGLSEYTTSWILDNALESDWFEDAHRESNEAYAEDILDESADDEDDYVSRFHEEAVGYGIMEPCTVWEDEPDEDEDMYDTLYSAWEFNVADERERKEKECQMLISEFAEKMMENDGGDHIEWFKFNFGEDDLSETAKRHNLVDEDAVAEMIIDTDGLGHTLSSYDGEEIDLSGNFVAFRTN